MTSDGGPDGRATADAIAVIHRRGRAAHPQVDLDLPAFECGVRERIAALLQRRGLAGADDAVLPGLHSEDLYLAIACARAVAGSWERIEECHSPRLLAFARARGADHAEARDLVADLPGTLLLPRADGRRPIDTYDGSVQLSTWLAMIVLRRLTDLWRSGRRTAAPLGADHPVARPESAIEDSDEGGHLAAALRRAWRTLADRERLVLLWKFRDDVPQRRIGELLGVGESRVSRLVSSALEHLRDALREAGMRGAPAPGPEVQAAVARHLANSEPRPEQPDGPGDGQ